jgi:hypothetical protein
MTKLGWFRMAIKKPVWRMDLVEFILSSTEDDARKVSSETRNWWASNTDEIEIRVDGV